MVVTSPEAIVSDQRGFTLVEFLISTVIMGLVLGATVTLAGQMQQSYSTQLGDAALEQEARYALDWIARDLRSAASNPYAAVADSQEFVLDPNGGDNTQDSIQLRADINEPDGAIDDEGEDIVIAFDPVNNIITRADLNAADPSAQAMTDTIFTDLSFTYLNAGRVATTNSRLVAYVQVEVTARGRTRNSNAAGGFTTTTLATEVRLRTR